MICILTQPLDYNYGAVLQAYALQTFLKKQGYESQIIDMVKVEKTEKISLRHCISIVKRFIKHYLLGEINIPIFLYKMNKVSYNSINKNLFQFRNRKLKMSDNMQAVVDINKLADSKFDTYIVGSDQVWRPLYSPYLPHFFLDFVKDRKNIKRIAYAASFGVDYNEFTDDLLKICKPLMQHFDAISVREDSGIRLCKELFDVNADWILDPTMLFDAEHYKAISFERNDFKIYGDLFAYVLDEAIEKQNIIHKVANAKLLRPFKILPKSKYKFVGPKHIDDCVLPPVEQWLRSFVDAKYVVTDSFHGTVFSILFKRPFIVIGNKSRGLARFTSLLKLFDLEDRLVFKEEDVTDALINKPINYGKVCDILQKERNKAKDFLQKALV